MKEFSRKVNQAGVLVRKKAQEMRKSIENNNIKIMVNSEEAKKQITQIEKEIDSLQKKITGRQLKLDITNNALDKIRNDTNQSVIKEMPEAGNKQIKQETYKRLDENENYNSLVSQSDKLNNEIERYNELLDSAKFKMAELEQQTLQTAIAQNKLSIFLNAFKSKIEQSKIVVGRISIAFKNVFVNILKCLSPISLIRKGIGVIGSVVKNIGTKTKGVGTGIKNGLGHVLKYAAALFSLRSIYSTLSSSAQAWLGSQNKGAQQLSANIEYMKYAMGSVFAPVIQYVTGLVYQLMKAIQSVVYAMSGVNIFAKATASSMKSTSSSAKQTSKSLASVHGEINNVSDNNSTGSNEATSPNMDLSQMDNQMSSFGQKLYEFFKPLKESWDNYGGNVIGQLKTTAEQIGGLISTVWKSFENIITNGTVYSIFENILAIIGNIAEAFKNAWQNNGNGDAIVQNIADMLKSILDTIKEITGSEEFQKFLNGVSNAFSGILTFLKPVLDDFLSLVTPLKEIALSIAGDILNSIGDALKWIGDNEIAVTILEALAIAIGLVVAGIKLYNLAQSGALVATLKQTAALIAQGIAWVAANWPILLIVAAITAVIAIIILCVKHWDTIKETIINVCNTIKETISNWCKNIGDFFSNLWENICNIFGNIGNWFTDKFNSAVQGIKNAFSSVKTFFSGIWNGICEVFGNVANWFKDKFSQAWQAVKNVFSTGGKIFDGIKDGILNGLKSIVNAIINGINKVISIPFNGLNSVLRKIRNAEIMGLKPFSWVGTINVPQIPRLAKGGVLTEATAVVAGEYSGAKTNPEIVTPQNIMRDTVEDVLSDFTSLNNSDRPINLTINVGNKKLGQILLDDLRDKTRRTGKDIEALIDG